MLMVFESHSARTLRLFGDESHRIVRFRAASGALLVVRAAICAFEETPEVNDFSLHLHRFALRLSEWDENSQTKEQKLSKHCRIIFGCIFSFLFISERIGEKMSGKDWIGGDYLV